MPYIYNDRERLVPQIFGAADLRDQRRTQRLIQVFDQCWQHPGENPVGQDAVAG